MVAVIAGWLFPWPARPARKQAIRTAAGKKVRAQRGLSQARRDGAAIARMAEENHYAERIARQIMGD